MSADINTLSKNLISLEEELLTLKMISDKINNDPNRIQIYRLIPEMVG